MLSNDDMLWCFSVAFIVIMTCLLVIPVLRRKSDVFTSWNMFLVGAILFNGFSGINATRVEHYFPTYRASDYALYYLGTVLFYVTSVLTYFYWKYPRRVAGRRLLHWPKLSGGVLVALVFGLAAIGMFQHFQVQIPFVGQLLLQFSLATPLLAFACAFVAWYRSPSNPLLMALLCVIGATAVFSSVGLGGSRRYLMSTLAVAPICLYWVWLRYKSTPMILGCILVAVVMGVPVLKGYSAIRHHIKTGTTRSAASRAIGVIKELPRAIMSGGSSEGFMGQDSVECAIMTIHFLNDNSQRLHVTPFHSVIYILVNPIPRVLWPEKPIGFGITLPAAAKLEDRGIQINLGVNVVGQCYYDGGFLMHILYGIVFGAFLRFYDELLIRQSGNPLLVGGLVFMAPQIIGFPRGGIETMGLQVFLGFIVVVLTGLIARTLFGTGMSYPRTDSIVDYPVLRSPNDWAKWMQSYTAPSVTRQRFSYDDEEEEG